MRNLLTILAALILSQALPSVTFADEAEVHYRMAMTHKRAGRMAKALKEAQTPPDADEIRAAQDAVKQAELVLAQAQDGASDSGTSHQADLKNAEAQVAQAEIALKEANINANNNQSGDSAAAGGRSGRDRPCQRQR